MKRILFFLALSFALCNVSMAQPAGTQKMEQHGKHAEAKKDKPKGKYNKHKHKHKHFKHTKRHKK